MIGACSDTLISGNRLLVIMRYIALVCDIMLSNAQIPCRTLLPLFRRGGERRERNRDESAACAKPTFHQPTLADGHSYGFRLERCCADALDECHKILSGPHSPSWILEGDVKACFDQIGHSWLMDDIPSKKESLKDQAASCEGR